MATTCLDIRKPDLAGADLGRSLRSAFGSFATGVTVITTVSADGTPVGVTANSFSSVSLDPPLVLWSLAKTAFSRPVFEQASHFAIHVLAADQRVLAERFATRGQGDKFAHLDWQSGQGGAPVLPGVASHFECATHAVHDGGDHLIIIGRVLRFGDSTEPTLAFHRGRFAACASFETTAQ